MLGEAERHGQEGVDQAEGHADAGCDGDAGPQVGTLIDGHPAGHRTGGHDPLDAEIEHAGPLADQLAQRAQEERGRDADGGGPEGGRDEDVEDALHARQPRRTR